MTEKTTPTINARVRHTSTNAGAFRLAGSVFA